MANQYTYTLEDGAEIHLDVDEDLIIEGNEGTELKLSGDDLKVKRSDDSRRVDITCESDCRVYVPATAILHIESLGGDAKITGVNGSISLDSVGSDLVIRDCATINIDSVGEDVAIKRIAGAVAIDSVGGDAEFREIGADLRVDNIGGDALIKDVQGTCLIDSIGGDLVFDTELAPNMVCRFETVGGDALCKIPIDANVRFKFPHDVERTIEIPNVRLFTEDDQDSIVVGDSLETQATVEFESIGGEFRLVGQGGGFHVEGDIDIDLDSDITEEIEESLNAHLGHLDEHLSTIQEQLNRTTERIQRDAEKAAERAQTMARRQAEQARKQAENARRQAERVTEQAKRKRGQGFQFEFSWPGGKDKQKIKIPVGPMPPIPPIPPMPPMEGWTDPPTPTRPVEPVKDEERMMILKMVESKQISIEEAEQLLAALETRE